MPRRDVLPDPSGPASDSPLDLWARRLSDAGSLGRETRLLDVGGGSGVLAAAIHALSGARCTVVDPARPAPPDGPGVAFVAASAEALPFADGTFDAILFSHALHHVADLEAALREAARVAAPGARLLIRTATHADLRALPHARWIPDLLDDILAATPDAPDIARWLSAAGWVDHGCAPFETPQGMPLVEYAEAVALQAFRAWALCPNGGPDPRADARAWAMQNFEVVPPVPETLITARKP